MRTLLTSLLLMLCLAAPLRAADPASGASPSDDGPPLRLGENLVLPRSVYAEILAREDGLATIERIQARAEESQRFEGVPHLAILFAGVLLFFWSSMFYLLIVAPVAAAISRLCGPWIPASIQRLVWRAGRDWR
jgi:hypothetical protein